MSTELARGVLVDTENWSSSAPNGVDDGNDEDAYVLISGRTAAGAGDTPSAQESAWTSDVCAQESDKHEHTTRCEPGETTQHEVALLLHDWETSQQARHQVGLQRIQVQIERSQLTATISTLQASLNECFNATRQVDITGTSTLVNRDAVFTLRTRLALDKNAWIERAHALSMAEERLGQLEQKQITADGHFTRACGRLCGQLVSFDSTSSALLDRDHHDADTLETDPALQAFHEANGWASVLQERLDQLDGEYGESLASSCVKLPKNSAISAQPTISTSAYHAAREELEHELAMANRQAAALKAVCFADGLMIKPIMS